MQNRSRMRVSQPRAVVRGGVAKALGLQIEATYIISGCSADLLAGTSEGPTAWSPVLHITYLETSTLMAILRAA
ncbi:hypothetical protein FHG87_007835 [Trinorchestia longiramus]|nr:hypothetical protein FHG87_007835 [Trinorchestia longiramus]